MLDQVLVRLHLRGASIRTEERWGQWVGKGQGLDVSPKQSPLGDVGSTPRIVLWERDWLGIGSVSGGS